MTFQFLVIYWCAAGFISAFWSYVQFKTCTGEKREELNNLLWELSTYADINEEMALWIVVAFELLLGGVTLPVGLINKFLSLFTNNED